MILLLMACLYDREQFLELSDHFNDHDGDGYSIVFGDCDDQNPEIHPEVIEYCDGIDNDCTGAADDDAVDILIWFQDRDGDGFGDDRVTKLACAQPVGYIAVGGDCGEGLDWMYPGAPEECANREDRNCDGVPGWVDSDGDGFNTCDDCNDNDAGTHPNNFEHCDGVDEDCDGQIDDLAIDKPTWYLDADGDGYRGNEETLVQCEQPIGYLPENATEDCDDTLSAVNTGAEEICDDLLDNNCDGIPACQTEGLMTEDAKLSTTYSYGFSQVAALEDQDNDGYDEFWVGELQESKITVVHGPVAGNLDIDLVDDGRIELSSHVSSIPAMTLIHDMDGNTFDEMMISTRHNSDTSVVYFIDARWQGTIFMEYAQLSTLQDDRTDTYFGWTGLDMGDPNGDGFQDMALSAPDWNSGAIYEFDGPIVGNQDYSSAQHTMFGEALGDQIGVAMLYSDLDGDGVGDWVVGAPGEDSISADAGAVYLLTAGQTNMADADKKWTGSLSTDALGSSLALSEDGDGDGLADVWMGSRSRQVGSNAGGIYLVPISASSEEVENVATVKIYGEATNDALSGYQMRTADMNRDGTLDLVTAAAGYDGNAGTDTGRVYLFYTPLIGTLSAGAADAWYDGNSSFGSVGLYFDIGDISGEGDQDIIAVEMSPLLVILPTISF